MPKFITSDYIFHDKNFNLILSNLNFSFPAYHVSFNLMSRDTDIISADISIFDALTILVMLKDFLTWKWRVLFMLKAIIWPSCQHCGNAVDMKVGNHIAM